MFIKYILIGLLLQIDRAIIHRQWPLVFIWLASLVMDVTLFPLAFVKLNGGIN